MSKISATKLCEALAVARVKFQEESKCFLRDDNTPVTQHDLHVLATAINTVLAEYESLISAEFYNT